MDENTQKKRSRKRIIRMTIMVWVLFLLIGFTVSLLYKMTNGNYTEERVQQIIRESYSNFFTNISKIF
ncbi:MAG TPA: hypothetical protein VJB65_04005 [Patescibacteria group bacterium]|nr:hypothetical protein [Patescibacteria group bacterium]